MADIRKESGPGGARSIGKIKIVEGFTTCTPEKSHS